MAIERWNDDRLDDFYEEFKRVLPLIERVGRMEVKLDDVAEDASVCRSRLHDLTSTVAAGQMQLHNDMERRAKDDAKTRKEDRRWLIGAILSTAALIIAAVGVIVTQF